MSIGMSNLVRMAESASRILEGVFAVSKPPSISSAQVLRDLQQTFAKSKTFGPLLAQTEASQDGHRSKRQRIDKENVFKMGHGGTLDPMATGILIVGIGRGTKHLQSFLECTKTYETVVLFGKGTDTYDVAGKIICQAPYDHITRQLVEEKLAAFRGDIKQVPPMYSALKINGIKAYEYAREGKELPRELASRDMTVSECSLLDWFEGGQHDFRWPLKEAPAEEKKAVQKLMPGIDIASQDSLTSEDQQAEESSFITAPEEQSSPGQSEEISSTAEKRNLHTHDIKALSSVPSDAPAARIRLTVSSGFYVRSFAHDLGIACKSFSTMSELKRSRQADYTLADPAPENMTTALDYEDLHSGEEVWGPKITRMLEKWLEDNPLLGKENKPDDRDKQRPSMWKKHRYHKSLRGRNRNRKNSDNRRRNSSSPD